MTNPLVLLPGLLCDNAVWIEQRRVFGKERPCVVPDYDLRSSITSMAEQVLAVVPDVRFSLAGHSMGGRVALEVIRIAPERVERLALLDTGYQSIAEGEAGQKEREERGNLLRVAQEKGMWAMGESWAPGMVHPEAVDSRVFAEILSMIERSSPERFEAQISALLNRPDASTQLRQINVPTMVICGRQDAWSPLARHEVMSEAIPGACLRVIEDSGHMTTMEQPVAVSAALGEWLDWTVEGA
ncbi:alpha/beta fold hydrolase [Paraburkholderia tuberum]|uniref:Pimeloyl-ACP methyl ester carboxylesterase n=1 Tax=Paraburkholderia tuberum TaxID=157910 RepID=A0A1H1KFR9_9BURK|nr:alpha/beta hydrolase [Paraburkholderia tuberum]SDR60912.1 Pimeloyl-ACP methyl ester carboxylesterase [Paraburkholderia tuberum]